MLFILYTALANAVDVFIVWCPNQVHRCALHNTKTSHFILLMILIEMLLSKQIYILLNASSYCLWEILWDLCLFNMPFWWWWEYITIYLVMFYNFCIMMSIKPQVCLLLFLEIDNLFCTITWWLLRNYGMPHMILVRYPWQTYLVA